MKAAIGFLILAAAMTFAAIEFYFEPAEREAFQTSLSKFVEQPNAAQENPRPIQARFRTFSPRSEFFAASVHSIINEPTLVAAPMPARKKIPSGYPQVGDPALMHSWSTVVVLSDPAAQNAALTPKDGGARYELALNLQQELRRVGCYWGPINGVWGGSAKRAMGDFAKRVNASLPMEHPDYALLTLVRGHPGLVCGASCQSGEVVGRDGRCVPSTVLAHKQPLAPRGVELAVENTVPPGQRREPLPGIMAVGAPPPTSGTPIETAALPPSAENSNDEMGYLAPSAGVAAGPDGFMRAPLPRIQPPGLSPRDIHRQVSRAPKVKTREARRQGVSRGLPPNRRYIPPVSSMGHLR